MVPVFVTTCASARFPITSTAPSSLSTFTRDRIGTRTDRSIRSLSRRALTSIPTRPELEVATTSDGETGAPGELAIIETPVFCPSTALTTTRPLRFFTVISGVSDVERLRSNVCANVETENAQKTSMKNKSSFIVVREHGPGQSVAGSGYNMHQILPF